MRAPCACALGVVLAACTAGPRTTAHRVGADVRVHVDGAPFATVHAAAEPRPFVWPLFAPGQVPVTRDFPMGARDGEQQDHPHHQSLWFAHGAVDGFDFWHGTKHRERVVLRGEPRVELEGDAAVVAADYVWRVDEGVDLLHETRRLRFAAGERSRTVEIVTTLTAAGDRPVRFGDTKEGTFALRVHPALRVDGPVANGRLVDSEGREGKAVWGKRARWIDDSGAVDGEVVGVAMFDHPDNLRHPTWWHARTYGLLGANPFGAHDFEKAPAGAGDFVLAPGERLVLRYLVVLHRGFERERIDAAWRDWAASAAR